MNYETSLPQAAQAEAATVARRRRRIVIVVAVAIAAAVAGWLLFGRARGPETKAGGRDVPTVSVAVPGRQTVERVIAVNGTLGARREMPVGVVGEGGLVQRVLVEPGQWVGAGQVLAVIERSVQQQTSEQLSAQINVARADARIAQQNLDRSQQLVSRGFVSKADVERQTATRDAANARVRVAEAALGENRARIGRLDIRAPAAGLVLTRAVEPGQVIGGGSGVLFRIAMGGQMELLAQLSEDDLAGLRIGARAQVTPVGSGRTFTGEVWQVSPIINPQTRQGIARIALAYDEALRPGGFAAARIVSGAAEAPLLPESAVQNDERGAYVYIVDAQNKVARRAVQTGTVTSNGVAITGGLNGSERVVLRAAGFLSPGETVRPQRVRQPAA